VGRGEERTREGVKPEGGRWEVELEVEGVELFSLSLSEFCLPLGGGGGFPSDEKLDPIVV